LLSLLQLKPFVVLCKPMPLLPLLLCLLLPRLLLVLVLVLGSRSCVIAELFARGSGWRGGCCGASSYC